MYYSSGLVLQKSGYIRDKNVKSGFIKNYGKENDNLLKKMFDYLIDKWTEEYDRLKHNTDNSGDLPQEIIDIVNRVTKAKWSWNNITERIDVEGSVDFYQISSLVFSKTFKGYRFGKVTKGFKANWLGLTDLSIGPDFVGGDYYIEHNLLKSFKGGPLKVNGALNVSHNLIESFEGFPSVVKVLNAWNNKLESLEGIPKVRESINLDSNQLKTLKHSPEIVYGHFSCVQNLLRSIEGGPKIVTKVLNLSSNYLEDLKGSPEKVGSLIVNNNPLKSIIGYPENYFEFDNKQGIVLFLNLSSGPLGPNSSSDYQKMYFNIPCKDNKMNTGTLLDFITKLESSQSTDPNNHYHNPIKYNLADLRRLIYPCLTTDSLVEYFKKNQLKLYLLDGFPERKKEILKILGRKDLSKIGKLLDLGII
jgi:hypothetical protein